MILNNIYNLIYESYIFSDNIISVDLDKFESGECSKLLISGISGSGKTSTGNYLSNKYKVKLIDTDPINKKIAEQYPREERFPIFEKELSNLLTSNERLIISGGGISTSYEKSKILKPIILKQSFVFLGKSALMGAWDGYARNSKVKDNPFTLFDSLKWNFKDYYSRETTLKKDRCAVKGSVIEDFNNGY